MSGAVGATGCERGNGLSTVSLRTCGGKEGNRTVSLRAGNKRLHLFDPAVWEPEHGVDPGVDVLMEEDVGEIASVVHHDIGGLQRRQVLQGAPAFIAMRDEVEIPGQLRVEVVEAAQQALRIVRIVGGHGIAVCPQRTGEGEFGAIHGKHPMPPPGAMAFG